MDEVFFYDCVNILNIVVSNNYIKLIFNVLIAASGGLAELILIGKEVSLKEVIGRIFLAVLVGFLMGKFCIDKGFPDWFTNMACATAGLSSKRILTLIQIFVFKVIPFGPNPSFKEGGKNDRVDT